SWAGRGAATDAGRTPSRSPTTAGERAFHHAERAGGGVHRGRGRQDRKSTRLNSSHGSISYAVFCLKKKNNSTAKFCARTLEPNPATLFDGHHIDSAANRELKDGAIISLASFHTVLAYLVNRDQTTF